MSDDSKQLPEGKPERIAKRLARAGLCSRRDAERWIVDGRVRVNGQVIHSPALNVGPQDKIVVDGRVLKEKEPVRLFLYHKPAGLVTTHKDEKGRPTVFERLPEDLPRLISVGRLDLNTEGLLLLTNDGELSRYLELPSTGWKRKYRVRVFGTVKDEVLKKLKKGVVVEGVRYAPIEAIVDTAPQDREGKANTWLGVSLREGKNREIRKVMEAQGLSVNRLIRTDYGPFSLGKLPEGQVQEVDSNVLRHQVIKFFDGRTDLHERPQSSGKKKSP
ncbi:MAG: rRNA pseudouridine synthase [Rhodospirillales bacterium]|nr:rRNA pseudouridine synthase [Alphaproteobacteria bacterium]MCB1839231.1 rRNA pseudouridine synthase [Alphaproteobacteria bacterium]MCB9977284.1 rRNA pseudouridine synthase [Rhodospirillales bacterium]